MELALNIARKHSSLPGDLRLFEARIGTRYATDPRAAHAPHLQSL